MLQSNSPTNHIETALFNSTDFLYGNLGFTLDYTLFDPPPPVFDLSFSFLFLKNDFSFGFQNPSLPQFFY